MSQLIPVFDKFQSMDAMSLYILIGFVLVHAVAFVCSFLSPFPLLSLSLPLLFFHPSSNFSHP